MNKEYRGPYSILPCPHCDKSIEAGPMKLADWVWCGWCNQPIHDKYPCAERCPKSPGRFDAHQYRDDVSKLIGQDVS